jgi:hypothetical protein
MSFNALFFEIQVFVLKIYFKFLNQIKMAKKKRNLDIEIKTKKVNIDIERKDGKLTVDVDTPIIDAHIEKDEELKVEIQADENLNPNLKKVVNTIVRKIVKSRK